MPELIKVIEFPEKSPLQIVLINIFGDLKNLSLLGQRTTSRDKYDAYRGEYTFALVNKELYLFQMLVTIQWLCSKDNKLMSSVIGSVEPQACNTETIINTGVPVGDNKNRFSVTSPKIGFILTYDNKTHFTDSSMIIARTVPFNSTLNIYKINS